MFNDFDINSAFQRPGVTIDATVEAVLILLTRQAMSEAQVSFAGEATELKYICQGSGYNYMKGIDCNSNFFHSLVMSVLERFVYCRLLSLPDI